jgi:hypothetical protein
MLRAWLGTAGPGASDRYTAFRGDGLVHGEVAGSVTSAVRLRWRGDSASRLAVQGRFSAAVDALISGCGGRVPGEETVAARRISLSSRSRRLSARNRLMSACSSLRTPRPVARVDVCLDQPAANVSQPFPTPSATTLANAVSDG